MHDPSRLCPVSVSIIESGAKLLPVEKVRCENSARYCQEISFADGNTKTKRLTTSCEVWKADYMLMTKSDII